MHSVRLRNGRMKTVLYTCLILAVLLLIYYIGDSHVRLEAIKSLSSRCEQQKESLSAQMQVLLEHKARLEKFLKQEEEGAKKAKEELQDRHKELLVTLEKERLEAREKLETGAQQHRALAAQHKDLEDEYQKLKQHADELSSAQHDLKKKAQNDMDQLRANKDIEIERLQKIVYKQTFEEDKRKTESANQLKRIADLEHELGACKQVMTLQQENQEAPNRQNFVERAQQQRMQQLPLQQQPIPEVGAKPPDDRFPKTNDASPSTTTTTTTPSSPLNADQGVQGGENKKTLDKPFSQGKPEEKPLMEKRALDAFSQGEINVIDSPVQNPVEPIKKPAFETNDINVVPNNFGQGLRPVPKPKEQAPFPRIQEQPLADPRQMAPPLHQGAMEPPAENNMANHEEEVPVPIVNNINNVIRPPNQANFAAPLQNIQPGLLRNQHIRVIEENRQMDQPPPPPENQRFEPQQQQPRGYQRRGMDLGGADARLKLLPDKYKDDDANYQDGAGAADKSQDQHFQDDGLDQQEQGEDQDLDNMDEENRDQQQQQGQHNQHHKAVRFAPVPPHQGIVHHGQFAAALPVNNKQNEALTW